MNKKFQIASYSKTGTIFKWQVLLKTIDSIIVFSCKNRYVARWSKKASDYTAVTVRVPKTYDYIPSLMSKALINRLEDMQPLRRPHVMRDDDPRRIQPRLASKPPPPIQEILERRHTSRFWLTWIMFATNYLVLFDIVYAGSKNTSHPLLSALLSCVPYTIPCKFGSVRQISVTADKAGVYMETSMVLIFFSSRILKAVDTIGNYWK